MPPKASSISRGRAIQSTAGHAIQATRSMPPGPQRAAAQSAAGYALVYGNAVARGQR